VRWFAGGGTVSDLETTRRPPTRVASVAKAARLLALVASTPEEQRTPARLAEAMHCPVPTTYHLLNTLVDAQVLVRSPGGRYRFGSAIEPVVAAYLQQDDSPPGLGADDDRIRRDHELTSPNACCAEHLCSAADCAWGW
jgi:hypothetical protein